MSILEGIRQRAASRPQHIVLPEGNDPRTVTAAAICARNRIARITLLGDEETIRNTAQREGPDLGGVEVIDHRRAPDFEKMATLFHEMRRARIDGRRGSHAFNRSALLRESHGAPGADGSVAGATNTTSHTVRPHCIASACVGIQARLQFLSDGPARRSQRHWPQRRTDSLTAA